MKIYLTRDSENGVLDPFVLVWTDRPTRYVVDALVHWRLDETSTLIAATAIARATALVTYRIAPETDRELVVVERPDVRS